MARQRKHPSPRHMVVVGSSPEEAQHRLDILREFSVPARGRAIRVDRLREALAIADNIPPAPSWMWRRTRGGPGKKVTPTREARAAQKIMDMFPDLTIDNATRIIEQARCIADRARGIAPEDRKLIEAARGVLGEAYAKNKHLLPEELTLRDRASIQHAATIVVGGQPVSKWDIEFLRLYRRAVGDGALTSVID